MLLLSLVESKEVKVGVEGYKNIFDDVNMLYYHAKKVLTYKGWPEDVKPAFYDFSYGNLYALPNFLNAMDHLCEDFRASYPTQGSSTPLMITLDKASAISYKLRAMNLHITVETSLLMRLSFLLESVYKSLNESGHEASLELEPMVSKLQVLTFSSLTNAEELENVSELTYYVFSYLNNLLSNDPNLGLTLGFVEYYWKDSVIDLIGSLEVELMLGR